MVAAFKLNSLLAKAKELSRWIGLDIQYSSNTLQAARTRLLNEARINLVLDVGANAGWYAIDLRRQGYKGRIISFEPLKSPFAQLLVASGHDADWTVHNLALGSQSGEFPMNVAENCFSSSLLETAEASIQADAKTRTAGSEVVQLRRLDDVIDELDVGSSNILLKMDTQGFELEVLRGAEASLRRFAAIECELSLVELYERQPLFYEVSRHLYEGGFVMTWIERGFRNQRQQLLQVESLFIARKSSYNSVPTP